MPEMEYHNPVQVLHSQDWLTACRDQLARLNIQHPLIITSNGGLHRLRLAARFPGTGIFSNVAPNPTLANCQEAVVFSLSNAFDGAVAIGGGSVMDTAKCMLAARGTGKAQIRELLALNEPFPQRVPSVFIPTTHGTASEVTMWGTLWDLEGQVKYSISHPDLYPDVAILDPQLTLSLPMDTSLITTLDALSHSFEAIWNKHANRTSTTHALHAIALILANAPRLKEHPEDIEVRRQLLTAATTAGLAFSNTRTAAAHSISYPLTIHFGIPHGLAASIALPPLLEINAPAIQVTLDTLFQDLALSGLEQLKVKIKEIPADHIPFRLRDWGVERSQLDWLTGQCFTRGRMDNNIVALTPEQVRSILEEIY
ncbi:MAG: phosphonoacetaldehyde reductase [Candidatus Neomarinimicrobiota bacterium]